MPHRDIEKQIVGKMAKLIDTLAKELRGIRTGRASAALLEGVRVDYYGSMLPINQLANINIPQPRLIEIKAWDETAVTPIEKAIIAANLGLNPSNEGQIIRLQVPTLTSERREEIIKRIHDIVEDFRIETRNIRREANNQIKKLKKDSETSEDDAFKTTANIQRETDKCIKEINDLLEKKEKEIREE
ncbi:MAG: ribosome recycling factor [Elusimicrobiota bacterium]